MKRLIPVLTVLLVLASVTTAMARNTGYGRDRHGRDYRPAETYHDSYVTLKLGVFMPDDDTDFLDTGISIGGALGHNLNRNFALEVGLDYTVADLDETYDYYDEAVDDAGELRPEYEVLFDRLRAMTHEELARRAAMRQRSRARRNGLV